MIHTTGIDTNVLLTFRLKRKPGFSKIHTLIERCLDKKIKLYLPDPVLLEMEWVLRSYYEQPKEEIISFFESLLGIEYLHMDKKDLWKHSLHLYSTHKAVSFTDCVIVSQVYSNSKVSEFLTFDEKLMKLYQTLE